MRMVWSLLRRKLILLSSMLNPVDNTFVAEIADLKRQVKTLQNTSQPYFGDWNSFNPAEFSYTDANTVTVIDRIPSSTFKKGDKLQITQSGTLKSFYITAVDDTLSTLSIAGGALNTFTNTTIDAIRLSRLPSPKDWPSDRDMYYGIDTVTSGTGAFTVNTSQSKLFFSMVGDIVRGFFTVTGTMTGYAVSAQIPVPAALRRSLAADIINIEQAGQLGYLFPDLRDATVTDEMPGFIFFGTGSPNTVTVRSVPQDAALGPSGGGPSDFVINCVAKWQLLN